MGLFDRKEPEGVKVANQMAQRNADLQERLYDDISEGLLVRGGPDYAGPIPYNPNIPIISPTQRLAQSYGLASTLSDKSQGLRDAYQSQLMGGGLGGLLGALGINTDYQSFGGLPNFFSGGGLLGSLGLAGGGQQATDGAFMSGPQLDFGPTPTTGGGGYEPSNARMMAQLSSADQSGNFKGNPMLKEAIETLGGGEQIYEDPYYRGVLGVQMARAAQQGKANEIGNELLQLAGLGNTPGIGFNSVLGGVSSALSDYDPYEFDKQMEVVNSAKPLRLRQAEQRIASYSPLMGMPMAGQSPVATNQTTPTMFQNLLGAAGLGIGLYDQFAGQGGGQGQAGGGGIGGLASGSTPFVGAPASPQAPGGGGIGALLGGGIGTAIGGPWGAIAGNMLGGLLPF